MSQYKEAGVDIKAGQDAVDNIKDTVQSTHDKNVNNGLGDFSGEYELTKLLPKYKKPVLISGTDGVGTKLLLAIQANQHKSIGIDLVAMCANDIIAQGADPLFLLDYMGLDKVRPQKVKTIIQGIAKGCIQSGLSLIGGEMAEMPDMYQKNEYDLSAFAVGLGEKKQLLGSAKVKENDILIGLPSNGIHSNGYSLVRKIIKDSNVDLNKKYPGLDQPLIDELLKPTKLYYRSMKPLIQNNLIHAAAHITGGGIKDNLSRIIPNHLTAKIQSNSWDIPKIFNLLQELGNVNQNDMHHVFNMGLGMIIAVSPNNLNSVKQKLQHLQDHYYRIGKVVNNNGQSIEFD